MWALMLLGLFGFLHVVNNERRSLAGLPPVTSVRGTSPPRNPRAHLQILAAVIKRGNTPQRWLVNEAMREAYDLGDWKGVAKLSSMFPLTAVSGEPPAPQTTDPEPDVVHTKATIVIGKNSPLKGVGNDEWGEFVEKLKTQKPDYSTEKHVGAFHHNRERLSQLEIDPASLTDEEKQYQAIEKDLSSQFNAERKLINEFAGDFVEINGESYPISSSGVLGVLKAAGPKHARSWFKNEEERKQFPHTTETFLRTNGLF